MKPEETHIFSDIPPALAMGITVSNHWKNGIELSAPLDCNRNDKGTAFAGSIASILTLAGWGLLTLKLNERGFAPDIMAGASTISYLRPAKQNLYATAEISEDELEQLRNDLQVKQRSRARLAITLRSGDVECATANADYALIQTETAQQSI